MSDTNTPETNIETNSTPDAGSPRPARKRTRVAWHGLRVLVLLVMIPLIFVIIAAIGLVDRNIAAPSWIKSRVAAAASQVMGGGDVAFGEIHINIGSDLHPRVQLRDTEVRDVDGRVIARIAAISGLMSPRGLIFQQDVLVQNVVLSGAQIDLHRNRDGSVAMAFGSGHAPLERASDRTGLLGQLDQTLARPALAALETIHAENLIIAYSDARAGRSWTVDDGTFQIDLRGGMTTLHAEMAVLSGGAGVTTLSASYQSPRGARTATLGLDLRDASAADLATQSAALSWLQGFNAPLSANLRTTLDAQGKLGELSATLQMGAGALQPNDATAPMYFDSAKTYLTFDPDKDRLQFDQIEVVADQGSFVAEGHADLIDKADLVGRAGGLPQALIGQFQFRDIVAAEGDVLRAPISLTDAHVDFRLGLAPFRVELGQMQLRGDGFVLRGRGDVLATSDGWQTAIDIAATPLADATVSAFWTGLLPAGQADWLRSKATWGSLHDLRFGIRQTPGKDLVVAGAFGFVDTAFRPIKAAPAITGAAGMVSYANNRLTIAIEEGRVTPAQGGSLNVAGSTMVVPDMAQDRPPVAYDIRMDGSVTATLALMKTSPFGAASSGDLAADFAAGRARTQMTINAPLTSDLQPGELQFVAHADLFDFVTDHATPGRDFAAQRLQLRADNAQMTITGPATFDGVPVTGTWRKPFDGSGTSTFGADLTLSQSFLDAFDIGLPPGSISGSGPARIEIAFAPGGAQRGTSEFTLTSRLEGLGIAIPPIGWSKPRNRAGNLRIVGRFGDQPTVDQLQISGGGLEAEGRILLNADGTLDRAIFSKLRVGNWLNAPITLRGRGANRPYAVSIQGGALDLRQARFGPGGTDGGPVNIALDRLQVTEGIALTRFAGEFDGSGGFSGAFTALLNGETALRGTVAPRNGRSAVRLQSNDAGGIVRAAGLMNNAVGGALDLTLLPSGAEGTFDGTLAIRQIRVRDVPAVAALLDAVSVVGLLQQLDGQGLAFEEVDARFRLTPEQVILAEASAVGPGLGISLDGIYTLGSSQVDFQGVVSPFYLINAIGSVLTRRGEGLIGFHFNILGSAANPQVQVNPLSAFTPGMFRDIFRRPPPTLTE